MTIVSHDKEPTGPTFCGFLPRRKDNGTAHGFSIRLVDPLPDGWGPQKDGLGKFRVHVYCLNSNPEKNHQSEMIRSNQAESNLSNGIHLSIYYIPY
jgi:hypothetical protein